MGSTLHHSIYIRAMFTRCWEIETPGSVQEREESPFAHASTLATKSLCARLEGALALDEYVHVQLQEEQWLCTVKV